MKEVSYKSHVLYDSMYTKCPEQKNPKAENRLVVSKGRRKGTMTDNGSETSLWGNNNVVNMHCGNGCTTVTILQIIEL